MLFGKKKQNKKQEQRPMIQQPKSAMQEAIEIQKSLGEEFRSIKSNPNDEEFRAILKETRKAYGLWYIYVRKHLCKMSMDVGNDTSITLEDAITEIDSLMVNAVYHLLYHTIGVRYIDSEITDDEGFAYIPIKKCFSKMDSDGKNRVVPALKKIGVVYDDFITDFGYDITRNFFQWLLRCTLTGCYLELKNTQSCDSWVMEPKYSAVGLAYQIQWILNRLHYPNKKYSFSISGYKGVAGFGDIGIICLGTEDNMAFDVGYACGFNDRITKDLRFYSEPVRITLNSSKEEFVALAERMITDYINEQEQNIIYDFEFDDEEDEYADEYR